MRSWEKYQPPCLVDHRDLVVTQPVDVILLQQRLAVVDQELPHLLFPEREDAAARVILVGEIEAVVVRRVRLPIEEPDALIVEAAASVVVNHVRDHRDPVEMAEIDERLELIDLPGELGRGERRESLCRQQPVHARHIRRAGRPAATAVIHLRRKEVRAVVAEAVLALIFLKRQRHDGVHAEVREIFDAIHHIQDLADAMRPDVLARGILRIEHADVKLIDDQIAESRRTEPCVVPW